MGARHGHGSDWQPVTQIDFRPTTVMTRKYNSGGDDAFAIKLIGKAFIDGVNNFRRRQVGWIPLLAFLIAIAVILWPDQTSPGTRDSFSGLAQVIFRSMVLVIWCPPFFAVAGFQWRRYRKGENHSTVIALLSMCLHGAVAACALVPVLWYVVAILR